MCVRVYVFSYARFARFVLLCLNRFVRVVWEVLCADVWFVFVFVFVCFV